MIIKEDKYYDDDKSLGYIDVVYESSNILQTTYFPKQKKLYISFNRGGVYSYNNIDEELYDNFVHAESQGKFFHINIKKNVDKYPFNKEYSLYPEEITKYKKIVDEHKSNKDEIEEKNVELKTDSYEEDNDANILTLVENILNFYANEDNYKNNMIQLDGGHQAKEAIKMIKLLNDDVEKSDEEYLKLFKNEMNGDYSDTDLNKLMNEIKNMQ